MIVIVSLKGGKFHFLAPLGALVLQGVCTHTDTEGTQRKARVRNILKSSGKNTIFDEHPVPKICPFDSAIWKHNSVDIIELISSTSNSTLTKTFHL